MKPKGLKFNFLSHNAINHHATVVVVNPKFQSRRFDAMHSPSKNLAPTKMEIGKQESTSHNLWRKERRSLKQPKPLILMSDNIMIYDERDVWI